KYMKNFQRRISSNSYLSIPTGISLMPSIGLWHVHGHWNDFFAQYSPGFIQGVGRVEGEIIETLWAILNVISSSARGMSALHRQELLDFQMNDSNFQKTIQMGEIHLLCGWWVVRADCCQLQAFIGNSR
ncbi:hypothetical protein PAXRUDRAFT_180413, partial [Paxillus rubicundulus Ve08.2h10]